ncbi:MAG: hypothetical protein EHM26_09270, partial [Desulfobacteraceae bacterium]
HPVNQGKLCIKGWNLHEYVNSFIRLKSPLIKKDGRFVKCTWEEAISHTAERLTAIVNQHGPDSVGVLLSAKMTNEENYRSEVRPRRNRHQQRGPLRPALTLFHRGRSCRGLRKRSHDKLDCRNRRRRLHLRHWIEHHRMSPSDRNAHLPGQRKRGKAHRRRPQKHPAEPICRCGGPSSPRK